LNILVELAEALQAEKDIFFLLIGAGTQYEPLKQLIATKNLSNIRLLPWQPTEMLPYTLAAADLGVVSLGKVSSLLSMPSKTFNLMSVGCPIMVIADPRSALAKLVDRYKLGRHFQTDAVPEMETFIGQLATDKRYQQQLQENVLLASQDFGPENARKFVTAKASAN
jgi:glycosyltransferase involved in cell wall biosynthesis